MHYLWSVGLSRSSSQLIVSILSFLNQKFIFFSQYYFNWFYSVVLPHIAYTVIILNLILFLVSSQVTFNQHFCQWRCFSFYWFGKREFGKFTNGIPVIGGPARPPTPSPPPYSPASRCRSGVSNETTLATRQELSFTKVAHVQSITDIVLLDFLLCCCPERWFYHTLPFIFS